MKIKIENNSGLKIKFENFVDREKERQLFWDKYNNLCEMLDEWVVTVLNYHGMGGVGKSQILKKLFFEIQEKASQYKEQIPVAYVSLSEQDSPIFIMNKLVILLKKYNYTFPMYEATLFELSRKSGVPSIKREIKSLQENSAFLAAILESMALFPKSNLEGCVFKIIDQTVKGARNYIEGNKNTLKEAEKMLPQELEELLPDCFAKDLIWNISQNIHSYPLIIILDKIDVFRERISGIDEVDIEIGWLKNEIISKVPNVVWVCAGREKLEWSNEGEKDEWKDSLINIPVYSFDKKWMIEYFEQNEINVHTFQEELFALTQGLPLYLDICRELYVKALEKQENIDFKQFQGKQEKLLKTYIDNLSDDEMYVLFILACIGEWDEDFINFVAQKSKQDHFLQAYTILNRKSYIETINKKSELHQVIREQIFAFCDKIMLEDIASIIYEYIPKDQYSWLYTRYLRCKLKSIKNDEEMHNLWTHKELQLLKDIIYSNNINGFETCYKVIEEMTEQRFEDSEIRIISAVFHIQNLIKLKKFKQAQHEANRIIRICKKSHRWSNIIFQNFTGEFWELKAQALDGQKKYLQALNIRRRLSGQCSNLDERGRTSRLHNLAVSYLNMKQYNDALEILEKVIKYRNMHKKDNPEDYIRALVLRSDIYSAHFEENSNQYDILEKRFSYGQEAYDEAHAILDKKSQLLLEVDLMYAKLMMEIMQWDEAYKVLKNVHDSLVQINQGRNAYIDEVELMLITVATEMKSSKEVLELIEKLEKDADLDNDDSERLLLKCKLEKSNSLSKGGEHGKAIDVLLEAIEDAKLKYGIKDKITLELQYALAVELFFVEKYKDCKDLLNSILVYVNETFSAESSFVYMIKKQLIRCEERI